VYIYVDGFWSLRHVGVFQTNYVDNPHEESTDTDSTDSEYPLIANSKATVRRVIITKIPYICENNTKTQCF
jgi:hypothetical protein